MNAGTIGLLGGVAVLGIVAFIFYQQQAAQAERERFARSPAQQIGGGVGNLVSGIIGMATGGGGST